MSQFSNKLAFESTGTCCAVVNRLFKLWYSDDTSVSSRATLTSLCGSNVFNPFSRNASITFQISTKCTIRMHRKRNETESHEINLKFIVASAHTTYNWLTSVCIAIWTRSDKMQSECRQTIAIEDLVKWQCAAPLDPSYICCMLVLWSRVFYSTLRF